MKIRGAIAEAIGALLAVPAHPTTHSSCDSEDCLDVTGTVLFDWHNRSFSVVGLRPALANLRSTQFSAKVRHLGLSNRSWLACARRME